MNILDKQMVFMLFLYCLMNCKQLGTYLKAKIKKKKIYLGVGIFFVLCAEFLSVKCFL